METKEIKAVVKDIVTKTTKAGKTFYEVLLDEQDDTYANTIPTTWWGSNYNPDVEVGDIVNVVLYVNGREYNGKYYVQLSGKKCFILKKANGIDVPDVVTPDEEMPF